MTCSIDVVDFSDDVTIQFIAKRVHSRKDRKCSECRGPIKKGDKYESVTGRWGRNKERHHTCKLCLEIRDIFFDSYCFGTIWSDMQQECSEEEIGIGQLDQLSPDAVGLLEFMMEEEWNERYELDILDSMEEKSI